MDASARGQLLNRQNYHLHYLYCDFDGQACQSESIIMPFHILITIIKIFTIQVLYKPADLNLLSSSPFHILTTIHLYLKQACRFDGEGPIVPGKP